MKALQLTTLEKRRL